MLSLTKNAIFNLSQSLSSHHPFPVSKSFTRVFFASSSNSSQDAREVFKTGSEGEGYKDNESVNDVANRMNQMTGKVKKGMQQSMDSTKDKVEEMKQNSDEKTGGIKQKVEQMKQNSDEKTGGKAKEEDSITEGPAPIEDHMKKLAKEPGGSPLMKTKGWM